MKACGLSSGHGAPPCSCGTLNDCNFSGERRPAWAPLVAAVQSMMTQTNISRRHSGILHIFRPATYDTRKKTVNTAVVGPVAVVVVAVLVVVIVANFYCTSTPPVALRGPSHWHRRSCLLYQPVYVHCLFIAPAPLHWHCYLPPASLQPACIQLLQRCRAH